ncbi:MAG TPA: GrpB family protein [Solirubrobacteraceae bacterium]|nr:GrpB family protein [Solirubrobacteraceae bacterium]
MNDDEPVLRTDEELAQYTVGELRLHDAPITLLDYDAEWPARFSREAERIRGALGAAAISVEHVGSTSVPGLAAKPIIDILLAVADSADEAAYAPALERAGYELRVREPDWYEHRMFVRADPATQVHVLTAGHFEIDRMLAFRDRLRTDDDARERYAATKRRLAARRWRHVQHYADAKTEVIEEILARPRPR